MKWKKVFIVFILSANILLNGCEGSKEINTIALAISMGIDKIGNEYSVTYQILNTRAIAPQKSSNESPIYIYTEKGKDLFEIMRRFTTILPRKIYNAHLRMIVFSEEVAKEGIHGFMDFFLRDHEFRTDYYFTVAKGTTAKRILQSITPLEYVSGMEMYNSIRSSKKAWTPTKAVEIIEFVNKLVSDGENPVLSALELVEEETKSTSIDGLKHSVVSKLKLAGLCAFKKDRLVGYLNENESEGFNYITGHIKDTAGFVQLGENNRVSLEVIKAKSQTKAYMLKGKPAVNVAINLEINIAGQTGTFDVSTEKNCAVISKLFEEDLAGICSSAVRKAQEELNTDIFGFGEEIHRTYPKLWKGIKNNWNDEFTKLPISINVHVKVKGLGVTTKSFFR